MRLAADDIGDGSERVTGNVHRANEQAANREGLPVVQKLGLCRNATAVARVAVDSFDSELRCDLFVSSDVVVMVMRAQNRDDVKVLTTRSRGSFDRLQDRRRFRDVD